MSKPTNSKPGESSEFDRIPADPPVVANGAAETVEASNGDADHANCMPSVVVDDSAGDSKEPTNPSSASDSANQPEGEVFLYPVSVKAQSGEKMELQLSPGDFVIDVRQFLLDAPETCFYTCYDLVMHTKNGSVYHLEDYNELSEVADITIGGCTIEMIAALYNDRSMRSHVRRTRELLSLSNLQISLSTNLALQQESTQEKAAENAKGNNLELDGLGFLEDPAVTLPKLLIPSGKDIKCVESIVLSLFNPPPSYRRLVGDLLYIDVVTLEGNSFCITGTTKGFYVNSSTGGTLDPKPLKPTYEANTLIGLLQNVSSKFEKGFQEILDRKASAHPFENVQSLLPPNTWLRTYPLPDHKRDAARAEDSMALSYGSELMGMQRDWNEELQSCRELPHKTLQERIVRNRALYRVTCDFVDAATKGAIGVINRCIPPINLTEPECFHMYVHNSIFFSYAVDADFAHISGNQEPINQLNAHQGDESTGDTLSPRSEVKTSNDAISKASDKSTSLSSEIKHSQVISVRGSDVTMEPQIADSEQATYASANNDLKGTKAYQDADVPGLYNLAMAIVDYRGYRVVAQSIIPGILQGDKSDSLLYGSVDNGKKICWSESFHSKVLEAAKFLHLKEHCVLDGAGNAVKLAAPVECKGIIGSDDRHYLLDLMRITPRDPNYLGPEQRFCVLRPELVTSFCEAEAAKRSKAALEDTNITRDSLAPQGTVTIEEAVVVKDDLAEGCQEVEGNCPSASSDSSVSSQTILLNPNVFTEFKLAGNEDEIAVDEEIVRKAGSFLLDVVIPKFVQDLCSLDVSPMDGQQLTESLHSHGINVRYLGKVANMVKQIPHLWNLFTTEIIVRSTKHILKDLLRESQDHELGPALAHFFNCFFGQVSPSGTNGNSNNTQLKHQKNFSSRLSDGTSSRKNQLTYLVLTSDGLWSIIIQEFARSKYQFELPNDARMLVKKVTVIRNLCQKIGIAIAARKYDLEASAPFDASDILDIQPVVKHSVPSCLEAKELMEAGKARLDEGLLNEAYTFFMEAFSLLQQITGPMHRDVAQCCRYLATVLYHAGDMAGAIVQQHKELIINERCLGLDHPDTAHSYGNVALFYHGLNQTELALKHMARSLLLLCVSPGPDHPDVAATFINVAMMYQDAGNMNAALRYLQEALKKNERLLGPDHIQTAVCYHALAIAFNYMGVYKLSVQHEKKTRDIFAKQLGENDPRTRDSENWINTFKKREQEKSNVQKQKGQPGNAASLKALELLKAHHPNILQALQAAGNASAVNKSLSAAMAGEALPRGRGVDERAAQAAAEVRKKAIARGIHVRQNGVPVPASPHLTQLLNILNSSANAASSTDSSVEEPKKVADSNPTSNGSSDVAKNSSGLLSQDQAPVGLGTSLASLESKKQKPKLKAAS